MSVTYKSIIDDAARVLNDRDNMRWSREELYGWILLAKLKTCLDVPFDLMTNTTLAATRSTSYQTVPGSSACSAFSVVRSTNGTPIKRIDRKILDVQIPDWRASSGSVVKYYCYDPRNPMVFSVYPAPSSSLTFEVAYPAIDSTFDSQLDYSALNETKYSVPDKHEAMILEFVLFMAFLKDADYAVNTPEAIGHYEKYAAISGGATQSVMEDRLDRSREDTYTQTPSQRQR